MSNFFSRLLCNAMGHKERRLRVGELAAYGEELTRTLSGTVDGAHPKQLRICDRCSRIRAVRARKKAGGAA